MSYEIKIQMLEIFLLLYYLKMGGIFSWTFAKKLFSTLIQNENKKGITIFGRISLPDIISLFKINNTYF